MMVPNLTSTGSGGGIPGAPGKSVELRTTETAIQWRQTGGEWQDLVLLADITGTDGLDGVDGLDGKSVELRKTETAIQWRAGTEGVWVDLVPLADLKGDPGNDGDPGKSAYQSAVDSGFVGTEAEWIASVGGGGSRSISTSGNAVAADAGKTIIVDSASAVAVTIPAGLNIAVGKTIGLLRKGTGSATFVSGSGVTLSVPATYSAACRFRYGIISAMHVGSNEYVVLGALGDA